MSYGRMFVLGVMLLPIVFVSQSCNNHFVQSVGPSLPTNSQSLDYFPLNEGFSTTYEINGQYGSTESITYTVGKQISFLTGIATEWISNKNGVRDTGYFIHSGNSLLFYSSKKAKAEVVLTEPLTVGKSWSRFDNDDAQIQDTTTIDVQNKGDSTDTNNGGILQVSFPTSGSDMLLVDKIESVELGRGGYFSKVVRISNDAGGGARNYYWYAAGVGMIKYVLGATDPQNPQGSVEAELVSYGNAY